MKADKIWKYLARKPKSVYKQLFVRDRWVAARTLYGQVLGEEARTPEEVAADYGLPLELQFGGLAQRSVVMSERLCLRCKTISLHVVGPSDPRVMFFECSNCGRHYTLLPAKN